MEYLSIDEVASRLHVSRKTVYMLVKEGKIPAIRIGVQWRIPESFLEEGTGNERQKPMTNQNG
ncbi:MAG TPA: helix-turn-helix domain-containing protein [Fervidobacterium sp.]|nr:helix-turn-helix domain-containing protein [Fervidobacterium sp.]